MSATMKMFQKDKQMKPNSIHNMDGLELLKTIPDSSINLAIYDYDYNISDNSKICKQRGKIKTTKKIWGEWGGMTLDWIEKTLKETMRCLRSTGNLVVFYDRLEITKIKETAMGAGFYPKNMLCLVKNNPLPHFRKTGFRSGFELGLHFVKEKGKFNFLSQAEMINYYKYSIGQRRTTHPTEKPLGFITRLVRVLTDKGDTVLDICAGSGTTAVACQETGRNFIVNDINKDYVEMIKKQIAQINLGIIG